MMPLKQSALVIGGQPKAGTSSLFHWLSQHPDVEASRTKEVRFFLDQNYPLPSSTRYNGHNEKQYLKFFNDVSSKRTLLDASPDYLYSHNALNIPEILPNARIVFIVRDPVDRIVSWYKFSAQIGRLAKNMNFEDFIDYQLKNEVNDKTPIHLRGLEHNRIGKYLPAFQERFGDRCLVEDFAQLRSDPRTTMQRICAFSELDPKFYDSFEFHPQNVSTGERASKSSRIYYRTRAAYTYLLRPSPRTQALVRPFGLAMKKALMRPQRLEEVIVPSALASQIRSLANS
jgi:hypothetical protein